MPTTVEAVQAQVSQQVAEKGIKAAEVVEVGTITERTQTINGKENPYESV